MDIYAFSTTMKLAKEAVEAFLFPFLRIDPRGTLSHTLDEFVEPRQI
jgi:hypothetical protein